MLCKQKADMIHQSSSTFIVKIPTEQCRWKTHGFEKEAFIDDIRGKTKITFHNLYHL